MIINLVLQSHHLNVMASQITRHSTGCLTAYAARHQRKHQSSAAPLYKENHRSSVDSPHKERVMQKRFYVMMSPCFDNEFDFIMHHKNHAHGKWFVVLCFLSVASFRVPSMALGLEIICFLLCMWSNLERYICVCELLGILVGHGFVWSSPSCGETFLALIFLYFSRTIH